MQKVNLYRYEETNKVTITQNKRTESDTPNRMRLIADENCILTNGTTETEVIDVMLDEVDKWHEINAETEATEADYKTLLDIITGGTDE